MKFTKKSRDLLIAMCLGDGYITPSGGLAISHCLKQKEYLQWKADLLKKVGVNHSGLKYRDNNGYGAYEVSTCGTKFLKLLRKVLYKPKKTISRKLFNRLDATGLAIWYMDDGSISNRKYPDGTIKSSVLTISTCITKEENQIFIDVISEKFGVKFGQRKMKDSYALICGTKEARKFLEIVSPTVSLIECMKYKLNVKK